MSEVPDHGGDAMAYALWWNRVRRSFLCLWDRSLRYRGRATRQGIAESAYFAGWADALSEREARGGAAPLASAPPEVSSPPEPERRK